LSLPKTQSLSQSRTTGGREPSNTAVRIYRETRKRSRGRAAIYRLRACDLQELACHTHQLSLPPRRPLIPPSCSGAAAPERLKLRHGEAPVVVGVELEKDLCVPPQNLFRGCEAAVSNSIGKLTGPSHLRLMFQAQKTFRAQWRAPARRGARERAARPRGMRAWRPPV